MRKEAIFSITLCWCILSVCNVYAQEVSQSSVNTDQGPYIRSFPVRDDSLSSGETPVSNSNINKLYAKKVNKNAERQQLREEWDYFLGFDFFYPYFKMKELESWLKEKGKTRVFRMHGNPVFDKDCFQYIFNRKF